MAHPNPANKIRKTVEADPSEGTDHDLTTRPSAKLLTFLNSLLRKAELFSQKIRNRIANPHAHCVKAYGVWWGADGDAGEPFTRSHRAMNKPISVAGSSMLDSV